MNNLQDKIKYAEGFPEAIKILKKNMILLRDMGAPEALAAISLKMVDAFEATTAGNFDQALGDIWGCSSAIHSIIYRSLVDKVGKESKRALAAVCAEEDKDFRKSYEEYFKANVEVSVGTGFESLFTGQKS